VGQAHFSAHASAHHIIIDYDVILEPSEVGVAPGNGEMA